MKKLMLTTALLAAVAFPALAQDGLFRNEMTAGSVRASDLIGARIYASETAVDADEYAGVQPDWDDIGEVNDVIVARDGKVEAVLVDIGGFLGMGERKVAVDMTALRFVSDGATADNADDWFLVMNANRAALEGAPEWRTSAMGADANTDAATADTATADANTTDATAPAAAGTQRDGYSTMTQTDLTADMLKGATAYDANDANIGEVGDLVLSADGTVESVVIDVGGFLGMGEKPVALPLNQVEILRQTDGNDVRVYVSMTKEQLEALPDYKS
jgi:hypothetical protein